MNNRVLNRVKIPLSSFPSLHSSAVFYKTGEAGLSPWSTVIMPDWLLTILGGINVVSGSQSGV